MEFGKNRVIFKCIHGSHLYGLSGPDSDIDYKGVFIPDMEEHILGTAPRFLKSSTGPEDGKNGLGDEDEYYMSIFEFFRLAKKGEMIAIDMIHIDPESESALYVDDLWYNVYKNKSVFYTKSMVAFVGYARKQAAKYGIKGSRLASVDEILNAIKGLKDTIVTDDDVDVIVRDYKLEQYKDRLPLNEHCKMRDEFYEVLGKKYQLSIKMKEFRSLMEKVWSNYGDRARDAKTNQNIDWKAVSHAIRASYQLIEIYETKSLSFPLKMHNEIKRVKRGEADFTTEAQPLLESLISKVEELSEKSNYPNKVNTPAADTILMNIVNKVWGLDKK
jgi:predicted DNA-binding protein YlxM (UPF0122 family)